MKYIAIKVDTNDADYNTSINSITDSQIKLILPVIEEIKKFKPYKGKTRYGEHEHTSNYPTGEFVRQDLGEKSTEDMYGHLKGFNCFDGFIPYGENGCHTIESVEIYERLLTLL